MKDSKKNAGSGKRWTLGIKGVKVDLRRALIGGGIAVIVILLGGWLVGQANGWKAYQLFKTTLPSTRSFCGTLLLALGNILALMLTLLSLSASMDINIKWSHYQRVRQISWVVTITLIITVLVYLLLDIPIVKSDTASVKWFTYLYYATLVMESLLGGSFITIVLLLYNTVRDMIGVLDPKTDHWLRNKQESEK